MNSSELRDLFRVEMADLEQPYGWSDEAIFSYIDDAQSMFWRKIGGIADASSPITQLTLTAGEAWVDTDPSILKFKRAYDAVTGDPIKIINDEDVPTHGLRFDGRVGPVKFLIIGAEPHRARAYPTPVADTQVQLQIDRLPQAHITDEEQTLTLDIQHHRHLLSWMKHLAYDTQDTEFRDEQKSAKYKQDFLDYCEQARKERDRAKHKTRVVMYGGI